MTKTELIKDILQSANIHHNISTGGLKLPDAPDDCPDDIFWNACGGLIDAFVYDWENHEPRNDSGNRNLCGCGHPGNRTESGACKKHDIWHIYTTGRGGATLYWDKYWDDNLCFKYDEDELSGLKTYELMEIKQDITAFNRAVDGMMKSLPDELIYQYSEWETHNEEEKRKTALGYYKTLEELLTSKNDEVVRHAKGILKALQK